MIRYDLNPNPVPGLRVLALGIVWSLIWLGSAGAQELFDRRSAEAAFNRGVTLYHQQRYRDAVTQFERAAGIDPEYAPPLYFMGYALYKLQQMHAAQEAFDRAYQVDRHYTPGTLAAVPGTPDPPDSAAR